MPTLYKIVKEIYHRLVLVKMRSGLHDDSTPLGKATTKLKDRLESMGEHDEIYDRDYYARLVDPDSSRSAPFIAQSVIDTFHPASVIDVGCGTGSLLEAFKQKGVSGIGLERSTAGIEWCKSRNVSVLPFDLEAETPLDITADVAMSMEVAEHIPEQFADTYVKLLTSLAPCVVITAAVPGQTGHDHVNLQPLEYWIEKFKALNMPLDVSTRAEWQAAWKEQGVESCYRENLLVFRRATEI